MLLGFKRVRDEHAVADCETPQWLNYEETRMETIVSLIVTLIISVFAAGA